MGNEMNPTALGVRNLPDPLFEKAMEHLLHLAEIHGNVDPQTPKGEELLEKIEVRMLDTFNQLPEGQV